MNREGDGKGHDRDKDGEGLQAEGQYEGSREDGDWSRYPSGPKRDGPEGERQEPSRAERYQRERKQGEEGEPGEEGAFAVGGPEGLLKETAVTEAVDVDDEEKGDRED
ncbi:MAG: hypothetical protein SFV54_05340 [Bryobacteraceae bacterium]|nr:hypothetical protein [Bryobacteraceae bacterium]